MKTLLRTFLVAAAIAVATPALAVDFAAPINNLDGTPMQKDDKTVLTLDDVASIALLSSYQDEPNLEGVEKNKRFWLAKKIHDQRKDPVLTADEIALIKRLIAKAYNPLVVGQAWTILDPASVPK
jgi:hypothetical protein